MPCPTPEQLQQARTACLEAAQVLSKHPEYDRFNRFDPDEDVATNTAVPTYTTVVAYLRFNKDGREIFRNPMPGRDYDFPDLVGSQIIEEALRNAAGNAGMDLTGETHIVVNPNEKGSVTIGYRFMHPEA